MKCPYCAKTESEVIYIRYAKRNMSAVRRRECLACKRRYTTEEKVKSFDYKHEKQSA